MSNELQSLLVTAIKEYVAISPLNRLPEIDDAPIWDEPLVGFVDGEDSLFDLFKTVVGEFHLMPRELLQARARELTERTSETPGPIGVVVWVLPAAKETRLANRLMTQGPSIRWNESRTKGEVFNDALKRHIVAFLEERGHLAIAPTLSSLWGLRTAANGPASTWSERHVAFAAGLGTFSLTDSLITARGAAHRLGSVVTNIAWEPTPREYAHHQEYCPFITDGSCGACITRCPVGALGPDGHDKEKCMIYIHNTIPESEWAKQSGYSGTYKSCGLCQTKVPCEAQIPHRAKGKKPAA